jgi:hypothetical protein
MFPAQLDEGESYSHPEYDWEVSVDAIDKENKDYFAKVTVDDNGEDWVFLPEADNFSLVSSDNKYGGYDSLDRESFSGTSGWIQFSPDSELSISDIHIRYMDGDSEITSDVAVIWTP